MHHGTPIALVLIIILLLQPLVIADDIIIIESEGCVKCAAAERVLNRVLVDHPDFQVVHYEFYTDEGEAIIEKYGVVDVPSMIIGGEVIGYRDYSGNESKLEDMLITAMEENVTNHASKSATSTNDTISKNLSLASGASVFFAGLVAGFNPCILAILAFLVSSILAVTGKRKDIILMVLFFSLGIFTVYFLFGLGIFKLFNTKELVESLRLFLSVLLVILGLLQLEDARRLGKNVHSLFRTDWAMGYFQMGVSSRKFSSYFILGALFSLVKAPCIAAIYMAILGIISEEGFASSGTVYLMLYNIGIVLPVVLLGLVMAFGMGPEKVDRFRHDHRVALRLVTGITLLALAPLIYLEIL